MKRARGGFLTIALFAVAATLLTFSVVGSSQAALNYFSDTYGATVSMQDIGVTLTENGDPVSYRNYMKDSNADTEALNWDESGEGELLGNMVAEGEEIKLGKYYAEPLAVTNTGSINEYVRVSVYKYWANANGEKQPDLDSDLIELDIPADSGWSVESTTEERTILFYELPLEPGDTSNNFLNGITLDAMGIESKVDHINVTQNGNQTVFETEYTYNGCQFVLKVNVDAVQTHNAADAMRSAWGVSYIG